MQGIQLLICCKQIGPCGQVTFFYHCCRCGVDLALQQENPALACSDWAAERGLWLLKCQESGTPKGLRMFTHRTECLPKVSFLRVGAGGQYGLHTKRAPTNLARQTEVVLAEDQQWRFNSRGLLTSLLDICDWALLF